MTDQLVDVGDYREQLVQRLECLAAFRREETAEHPDEDRIARSAAALRTAASEVAVLADDDSRLRGLATVCQAHKDAELTSYVEAEDRIVGRHGLGAGATLTTDELLAALAQAAEDAARRAPETAPGLQDGDLGNDGQEA